MIVEEKDFFSILDSFSHVAVLALDTETTGLHSFRGDELFSIIIYDGNKGYYFNFNDKNVVDKNRKAPILPRNFLPHFKSLFDDPIRMWILANAKFDMHMLAKEGLFIRGSIWDDLVMARIEANHHMQYSLDKCAERIGLEKSDAVNNFIKQFRCYKKERVPGKKQVKNNPQFWVVPLDIIAPYGITDAEVTFKLYEHQEKFFREYDAKIEPGVTPIHNVVHNEMALTKVCFEIERRGMLIDEDYIRKAMDHEASRMAKASEEFKKITGDDLVDSFVALRKSFGKLGLTGGKTAKGGMSFKEEVLSEIDHPAARAVLEFRDANKRASSYYSSFLYFRDEHNVIHCNIRQSATATGRFSITDPALQTLTSEDSNDDGTYESEWRVRKSFIPRQDHCFVAIDYKAFEFRAMLDTAGERELADSITRGLDPHNATAELVGITRKQAKTLNFGLLYGMGSGKLALALGITDKEARAIKDQYFDKLPAIKKLIWKAQEQATKFGQVTNRFGRVYRFPDTAFAYKALNALIQGGTADAVKFAMVELHTLLEKCKSGIVLQIHDEILFEIHKEELHLIPQIKEIMEKAWPERFHKMECSVEHSWKSWGDLVEGLPSV